MEVIAFIIFLAYGVASELLMRKWRREGKITDVEVG